ncbi:ABC transporter permease [Nocardioides cheoyonin]|uniref:ABC transporter permease n=1 Tax=Nocardioides cheoyonin TaxID=3156615 RepID=UPI0032B49F8F
MRILKQLAYAVALPAVLIAIWWVLSADSTSYYYPPLKTIVKAFPDTWTGDRWLHDVVPSLVRLALGYAIALATGVAVGTTIGLSRTLRALCEPALEFFRALPPPVLVPLIALFAGYTGSTSKVLAIALGCVWPILLNTVEGVRGLDEVLLDTARCYRLRAPARLMVVLRGSSPQVAAGARQALSIGVILMVISELLGANRGLGATVVQFQRGFQVKEMWTGIILLGLIGVLLSVLFRIAEHFALAWYRGLRQSDRGV